MATLGLCFTGLCVSTYAVVATGPGGTNAQAVHALGYTGAGVNVGLVSLSNTLVTHEAFFDKDTNGLPTGLSHAFWHDATNDGDGYIPFNHDTWVAGVIASRGGVANPNDIGVAPGVNLYDERVASGNNISSQFIENALDDLVSHNCRVVFTALQIPGVAADGDSVWSKIYDYYADTYNIVFANPAGNHTYNDPNNKITVFGDAYNGLTTAGLSVVEPQNYRRVGYWGGLISYDQVTNIGPTSDGRRKPDVAAPVQGQTLPNAASDTSWITWSSTNGETSFAAPHTAGVAALLLEYADSTTDTADNQNEVIRAVIANSTFPNVRDNNNVPTTGQTYNTARGYGRLDALRAFQTLTAGKIIPGGHTTAMKRWAYDGVRSSTPDNYYVTGSQNQRLKVTLAWNRIVNRNAGNYIGQNLTNLGMHISDPDGQSVFNEANANDNLRKCDLLMEKTGEYHIQITSPSSSSTNYGLAFEIIPAIIGDFDLNYIVDYDDLSTFASEWLMTGTADLTAPAGVDFADFAVLAQNWLTTNEAYYYRP
jgi:hypothetical protein